MSTSQIKRINQLKFIANIFNMSLKEIKDTLGFETLTMIFRRVGEASAENIVKRFAGKYHSIEEFCNLLIKNIIEPIIGENMGSVKVEGNTVKFELAECPYKKAGGFPIKEMGFFCHYTEGLLDQSLRLAFPDKKMEMKPNGLISSDCAKCSFEAKF